MSYNEKKLLVAKKQMELSVKGFDVIVEEMVSVGKTKFYEALEPYFLAIEETKCFLNYYEEEVKKEKAKKNA